jgi:hypothetical protein
MSYSGVAFVAIGLALLAVAVAAVAGVLLCIGRRRLAERLLPVFLSVLAGGIVVSLVAVWKGPGDLQAQAERTLMLAGTAERAELAHSGRYTISVRRLERLNRGLEAEVNVDGAVVRITRGPGAGNVTLWASLGPGTRAQATLQTDGRLEEIDTRGAPAPSARGQVPGDSGRHPS